ncbi:MAG: hypothetical protein IPK42_24795 [Betaproteobacteria bacterium]|nr:hypothetical protein [Betaproteobacteria bacterium]
MFNLSAALPEIQRLGYQVMQAEDPGAETMASWVAGPDGKLSPVGPSAAPGCGRRLATGTKRRR